MLSELRPIVDWLTYKSYEHNRRNNPHIAYYRWRRLYRDFLVFEEIYDEYLKKIGEKL